MTEHNMDHMRHLDAVAAFDVATVRRKESTYQGSWKRAGGRSAWFMMRRKLDRLLVMMARPPDLHGFSLADLDDILDEEDVTLASAVVRHLRQCYVAEDVFAKVAEDASGGDGSVLAELRDLRQYLLLVEAEMVARGVVRLPPEPMESAWQRTRWAKDGMAEPELESAQFRPGTPEDGGHHAPRSLAQGIRDLSSIPNDPDTIPNYDGPECLNAALSTDAPGVYTMDPRNNGLGHFIVDRRAVRVLRPVTLRTDLNDKEHELTAPHFRGLYEWREAELKWVMRPEYQAWGARP